MEITLSRRARDYILERGGRLYLWVDEYGLVHSDTATLGGVTEEWASLLVDSVRVFVAPGLSERTWRIGMTWLPWRRLDATSDLTQGVVGGSD